MKAELTPGSFRGGNLIGDTSSQGIGRAIKENGGRGTHGQRLAYAESYCHSGSVLFWDQNPGKGAGQ